MKLEKNLETAIGLLDNLLSKISPDHPKYDAFARAVNTAARAIKTCHLLKIKKQKEYMFKKEKTERKSLKNDSN
jgi:hypothetical protein